MLSNLIPEQFRVRLAKGVCPVVCARGSPVDAAVALLKTQKQARTLGADRAYGTNDFVAALRRRNITPHVAQNLNRPGGSAILVVPLAMTVMRTVTVFANGSRSLFDHRLSAKQHQRLGFLDASFVNRRSKRRWRARVLYEDFYCARGEAENRIKECQLDLFADRLSTATLRGNQLRLWWASAAYVLMHTLRRIGLAGTALSRACATTIRLRWLKIGAVVTISVRRVRLAMSSACPNQREFITACHALDAAAR